MLISAMYQTAAGGSKHKTA